MVKSALPAANVGGYQGRSVQLIFSSRLDNNLRKAAIDGVRLVINHVNPKYPFSLNSATNEASDLLDKWTRRSIKYEANEFGSQADAEALLNLAKANLKGDRFDRSGTPIIYGLIVDTDLTIRNLNYVYGLNNGDAFFVVSARRFMPYEKKSWFRKFVDAIDHFSGRYIYPETPHEYSCGLTRRITAHEFMHALGLVSRTTNREFAFIKDRHCKGEKGPCLMRQEGDKDNLVFVQHLEETEEGQELCPDCIRDLNNLNLPRLIPGISY